MRAGMWVALTAVVAVAGCSTVRESRLNPLNWFGSSQSQPIEAGATPQSVLDGGRFPVAEVTQLHIEPTKGGAIIRAVGVPASQGWYRAELVSQEGAEGELSYRFVLQPPPAEVQRVGTPLSREVTAATFVKSSVLDEIRTVTVTGERNARSTRRR